MPCQVEAEAHLFHRSSINETETYRASEMINFFTSTKTDSGLNSV